MTTPHTPQTVSPAPPRRWDWPLWRRWVAANTAAELVGLGLTGVAVALLFPALMEAEGAAAWALMGLMVAGGTLIEGLIVGTAQWSVLRRPLPRLTWRAWAAATAAGALVAWTLGMLPSTLINAGAGAVAPAEAAPAMSDALQLLLAAPLGAFLGLLLGTAQWTALRRRLPQAAWWIAANVLAWMGGMPLIFAGMSAIPATGLNASAALVILLSLAAAGATVGAVHGLALIWLVRAAQESH